MNGFGGFGLIESSIDNLSIYGFDNSNMISNNANTTTISRGDTTYLKLQKDSITAYKPIYAPFINSITTATNYTDQAPSVSAVKKYIDNRTAYGQIYVTDGTATQSLPSGSTYTKITLFTDTLSDGGYNVTSSAANDQFTCKVAGMYRVSTRFSGTVSNSCSLYGAIFRTRNSVASEMHNTEGEYRYGSTSDFSSTPAGGLVYMQVGDIIDFRIRHTNGSAITFTGTQLSLDVRLERAY